MTTQQIEVLQQFELVASGANVIIHVAVITIVLGLVYVLIQSALDQ